MCVFVLIFFFKYYILQRNAFVPNHWNPPLYLASPQISGKTELHAFKWGLKRENAKGDKFRLPLTLH